MDLIIMHFCNLNKIQITLELPNAVIAPMSGSSSQKLVLRGYRLENHVFILWLTDILNLKRTYNNCNDLYAAFLAGWSTLFPQSVHPLRPSSYA